MNVKSLGLALFCIAGLFFGRLAMAYPTTTQCTTEYWAATSWDPTDISNGFPSMLTQCNQQNGGTCLGASGGSYPAYWGIVWRGCTACPTNSVWNTTTAQCDVQECQANPATAPDANMHWDSADCRWEFDQCTPESPLDPKTGMWASTATGCSGGCWWAPYTWEYATDHWVTNWRQNGNQCLVADEAQYTAPLAQECESWQTYVNGQCTNPTCGLNFHWDDTTHACVADETDPESCPAGEHYVAGVGCVDDDPLTFSCPSFQTYDAALKRCVTTTPPVTPTPVTPTTATTTTNTSTTFTSTTVTNTDGSQTTTGTSTGTMSGTMTFDFGIKDPQGADATFAPSVGKTFVEVWDEFAARVEGAPIFQASADLAAMFSGSSACPFAGSFEVLGGSMSMAWVCDIGNELFATLAGVFLVLYALLALRVIWSA